MNPELRQEAESLLRAAALRRRAALAREWEALYTRSPALKALDEELRQLTSLVALSQVLPAEEALPRDEAEAAQSLEELKTRRQAVISALGPEALPEALMPRCAPCGDTGVAEGQPCGCLREAVNQLQSKRLRDQLDLDSMCFARFKLSRFSSQPLEDIGISPREVMVELRDMAEEYTEGFGPACGSLL